MNSILAVIPLVPSIIAVLYISNIATLRILSYSVLISTLGFIATNGLIPIISEYTLRRGLSGKDMGKKGLPNEDKEIPEALGIVPGIVYLICTILSQLVFAQNDQQKVIFNSALFSICFMIFLGFMDDTLDLKWRYKLFLPTIASLPLLSAYSGSTAMYLPKPLSSLLMINGSLTFIGKIINLFVVVDTEADGSIIELGYYFLVFMGLQSVFCTNAINILAGINGLECGQAYIIACSLLFFKLFESIFHSSTGTYENEVFAIIMILPFVATSLGLLRHNWYPAKVFVGDTYCYFAGMTFAVVGIHSHFSKTLLLLFIPQIFNFLYSIPQLFKLLPCPRHRLPRVDQKTRLMHYSTFPCQANQYLLFKVNKDDTECPNCTLICATLRLCGPMYERTLCIILLGLQIYCSALAFIIRYYWLDSNP